MAETDPFGRDKSEDPLAEMGWSSSAAVPADAGPADVAPPEQPEQAALRIGSPPPPSSPTPTPPMPTPPLSGYRPMVRRRQRSRGGCVLGLVVLAFIGATAFAVVPAVIEAIDTAEREIDEAIPDVPEVPPVADDDDPARNGRDRRERRERQAGPPRGLAPNSLFRRGNLAPVLRTLERRAKGRIQLVRLDAEDLLVTAVAGGRSRIGTATWQGDVNVLSSSSASPMPTFPWSRFDPSAPNRIVRAATRGRGSAAIDYLVLTDPAGPLPLGWSAFLRNGKGIYNASPDGRTVRKVG